MSLACDTFAPLLLFTLLRGDAQMFTPPATEPPLLLSIFTPLAPLKELPARLVDVVLVVVTVEPATAILLSSVEPAVMLFIWLSLIA
jgi:hypothetical protein